MFQVLASYSNSSDSNKYAHFPMLAAPGRVLPSLLLAFHPTHFSSYVGSLEHQIPDMKFFWLNARVVLGSHDFLDDGVGDGNLDTLLF